VEKEKHPDGKQVLIKLIIIILYNTVSSQVMCQNENPGKGGLNHSNMGIYGMSF
jgi:hypothetical protein